jgi:hypothetical protein
MRADGGPEAVDARGVDDVASLSGEEHGHEAANAMEDAVPTHGKGLIPGGSAGRVRDGAAAPDPCIVEKQVDRLGAVGVGDVALERLHLPFVGDIAQEGANGKSGAQGPGCVGRFLKGVTGQVAKGQVGAFLRESQGEFSAHAGAGAGDHRQAVRKVLHGVSSPQ